MRNFCLFNANASRDAPSPSPPTRHQFSITRAHTPALLLLPLLLPHPPPTLIYCALVAPQAAAAAAENHFAATFASSHDDAGPQSGVNSSRRAD